MQTIRFGSTDDLALQYKVTLISTSEVDAIVMLPPNKVPTSVIEPGGNTQGTLYINYNQGSLTNTTIRLYDSYLGNPTSSDWYTETIESDTNGVATLYPFTIVLTSSCQVAWHYPIGGVQSMKFTVQASGTITGSAITLNTALRSN